MQSRTQNAFVDRLLRNDSTALYELRREIEGLLEHPGWDVVMGLVEQRISDTQLLMETGLHQHPEYTAFIGEIRGMRAAKYAAEAVLVAADRREEQDRQLLAQMAGEEN